MTSSPSAALTPDPYLELAVQDSPGNPPAAWLWKPEQEILGTELRCRIGGGFVWPPAFKSSVETAKGVDRVVMVAGGVGIK